MIVRALGMKESVKVDTLLDEPQPGDVYLLCSDGLCGPVNDEEIRGHRPRAPDDLKKACAALIDRANQNGGPDNITVVAAKVVGTG